jgi:hypothetical protein
MKTRMGDNGKVRETKVDNAGIRHMTAEEVEKYSLGDYSDKEAAPFDEHLLICEVCRASVEASDTYVASIRAAAREIREEERLSSANAPVPKPGSTGANRA